MAVLFAFIVVFAACGGNTRKKVAASSADAGSWYSRGQEHYKKQECDQAISVCSEALRIGPAYYDKGDYDRAIADFSEAALRIDPNNANIKYYLEEVRKKWGH